MELALVDEGDIPVAQDTPAKRRRGRPKRDPETPRPQNFRVPQSPGITSVKGNQPHQTTSAAENPSDEMIGQQVSGFVEATFDAGYLLKVRVGNSDITLRGIVFKPGSYVPISPQNDLAPNAPMIRRQEIPIPRRSKIQVQRSKYQSGKKSENSGTVSPSNEATPVKRVSSVSNKVASPLSSRATFVPSPILDGINITTPAPHLLGSNYNQPPEPKILAPPQSNQVVHNHKQSNQQEASTGLEDEGEVIKRNVANHSPGENTGFTQGIKDSDMSEPLLIQPLQAFQPGFHEQSVPVGGATGNEKVGKMMELLQVMQENMKDNQQFQHQPQAHKMETRSSHEMKSSGSEDTHEEFVHSNPHSQASSF